MQGGFTSEVRHLAFIAEHHESSAFQNKFTMRDLKPLLDERRRDMLASPLLKARYESQLLQAFPLDLPCADLFHKNSFTDDDERDYLASVALFKGKKWNEVDFEILYSKYIQFLMLETEGKIYYLPAFLKNFYDLRFANLEWFGYFLADLECGFSVPFIDELDRRVNRSGLHTIDYSSFDRINPIQSKLVALFLVNVANLFPEDDYYTSQAQSALTNYWGNFLLF